MAKNKTYEEFVEKFKPKKTTDDCYTPSSIYAIVRDWACKEYGIDPSKIVRPFWPGGDYERFEYPEGCVVLDNPPFSIFSKICEFYLDREIPFFLFAPSLTALSGKNVLFRMNHIITDCGITYENGAVVRTSFVTSYGGDIIAQTAPELTRLVNNEIKRLLQKTKKHPPRYCYPDHVVTSAMLQIYSKYGIEWALRRRDCCRITKLDSQIPEGKTIYGGGLLVSNTKAAEHKAIKEAVIKEAAIREVTAKQVKDAKTWELSEREREIIARLD